MLRAPRLALLMLVVAGCGTPPVASEPQVFVTLVSGDNQTASVSTALQPFKIRVKDELGVPVAGRRVRWNPILGGGAITPGEGVTDALGEATAVLTLGANAGTNSARATVTQGTPEIVFSATATSAVVNRTPVLVASVGVPATYGHHDTFVRDGLAFVCAWNAGVYIYDVGNGVRGGSPNNPELVSQLITNTNGVAGGAQVHNAWWFHNPVTNQKKYLFIGQEGPGTVGVASAGDIHIVDVSNLAAPVEVGFITVPGAGAHNFWMDEARQILYAAYYNGGVIAVDVSGTLTGDMSSRIVAQVQPGGANNTYIWGVMLAGGRLYATDMLSGLWVLDPLTLATLGGGNNVPTQYVSDLWVTGTTAYTGGWGNRNARGNSIRIWDVGGTTPAPILEIAIPNATTVSDVAVTPGNVALVATAEGGAGAGLYVYSLADPRAPVLRGSVVVSGGLHTGEIAVINGRTYVFTAKNPASPELRIYDITGTIAP
ncbi:MAG: hypothetical protein IPG05_09335 [Gemmatimonadetes bacterium]|nr:hypothetical protein [Gemmatimonadota bacterium]